MARRKNSAALFEVIRASKLEPKPPAAPKRPGGGWWFGRRATAGGAAAAVGGAPIPASSDPTDPTANVTAASLLDPRRRGVVAAPAPAAVVPAPAPAPAASIPTVFEPDPEPVAVEPVVIHIDEEATIPTRANGSAAAAPGRNGRKLRPPGAPRVKVALDEDRQEVTFKLRYTTALVTAFAVLVVIGLAYVIGRQVSGGPAVAAAAAGTGAAPTSDQLKKGPPQPSALDVRQRATVTRGAGQAGAAGGGGGDKLFAPPPRANVPGGKAGVFLDAPVLPDGSARRTNNMNYLLIQAYPPEMHATAVEVRDFFVASGIPCTVERDSSKIKTQKGWCGIVGTRGFPQGFGSTDEYQSYVKFIQQAAGKYPNKAKLYRVSPMPFKWVD